MNAVALEAKTNYEPLKSQRATLRLWVFSFTLVLAGLGFLAECLWGPMSIPLGDLFGSFYGDGLAEKTITNTILWEIRLPRACMALLAGGALALSGVAMQSLFRNPLADPTLLGVSSGAAVASVSVIVLFPAFSSSFQLSLAAMFGGLVATVSIFCLGKNKSGNEVARMLLAGIAINALSGSLIGLMLFLADDQQQRGFIFWSLGSLARAGWREVFLAALIIFPFGWLIWRQRDAMNALLLGEVEMLYLGWSPKRVQRILIFSSALLVGVTVAFCGVIGFVGLVVPHLIRLILGPDHRGVLPCAIFLGAALLAGADLFSRTLVVPAELPLGIVTALVGSPFFLWLMSKVNRL